MEIFIKLASREYEKLRSGIPDGLLPMKRLAARRGSITPSTGSYSKATESRAASATRACSERSLGNVVQKSFPRFKKRYGSPSPSGHNGWN